MSRYRRLDPHSGWHHITNHAVADEELFLNDQDRHRFVGRVFRGADNYHVVIVAYVLMGNHFHLVLRCPTAGVSRFMHYLESVYAREFNMRHARRGPLFVGDFFNKLILDDGQAMATIRYVHRNPLELGIDIRTYPWSSYPAYTTISQRSDRIDTTFAHRQCGGPDRYRAYVEKDFASDAHRMSDGTRQVILERPKTLDDEIHVLCTLAAGITAVSVEEIVAPRSRARNDARLAIALVAYESRAGFSEDVRRCLGYRSPTSLRTAVKRARDRCESDATFQALVARLRELWATNTMSKAS